MIGQSPTEKSHRRRRLSAALMLSVALSVPGLPAGAETLEDALVATYNTNPTLLAERARLRATDENVRQAVAGWLPSVTVSGSYEVSNTTLSTGNPFQTGGGEQTLNGRVTATQNVFTGFRTYNSIRQARQQVAAGRATLTSTEQTVLLQAVAAYLDVQRDQRVLEISQNNVAVLQRQLEAAQDRFRVGEITRTDVAQAQARLEGARANLIQAEAQLTASRSAYERVIGMAPGTLEPPPPLPGLPETEEAALAIAIDNNPTLSAARATERASRHATAVAKGRLLPSLSLQGQLSHLENNEGFTNQVGSESVTAQVSMPIFQGGSNYSQIRQARALNSRDRLRIAETQRSVEEDVSNAWENLRSARGRIASTSEQVRAAEIAFDGVSQEAMVGSRTTLDVLDAEQELLDARVALVRAQRDEYVAAYNLLSVTGRLTAGELGLPVDVYVPDAHHWSIGHLLGFGNGYE